MNIEDELTEDDLEWLAFPENVAHWHVAAGRWEDAIAMVAILWMPAHEAKAIALLELVGQKFRLGAWLEHQGEYERALAVYQELGRHEGAARCHEHLGNVLLAAECYEAAGDLDEAALCHEAAGNLSRAAICYIGAKNWSAARYCYALLDDREGIERAKGDSEDWNDVAREFEASGHVRWAAFCYEKAGNWPRAGTCHEEQAAASMHQLKLMKVEGEPDRERESLEAAAIAYVKGQDLEAARRCLDMLEDLGAGTRQAD